MTDLGTSAQPSATAVAAPAERAVVRRRSLPGGRAVVGALLITLAAVGVFAAWLQATAAPTARYLVAAADIAPGTRMTADLLREVAIDLPAAQADAAVTRADQVLDRVALGPVAAGDLLQRSTFLAAATPPGTTTFTFSIPAARALAGDLVPGDHIDVIATYADTTGFVARAVPVLSAVGGGGTGALLITVAVDDPAAVLDIANALDNAQVHVARTDPDVGPDERPRPVADPLAASTGSRVG